MSKLPVDLRPALAAEKKWFESKGPDFEGGCAIIHRNADVRYESDTPSRVLTGMFPWGLSKAGLDFWSAACERLQLIELHKQKEAERLAPIRAERARRHRRKLLNRRFKFMQKAAGYKS